MLPEVATFLTTLDEIETVFNKGHDALHYPAWDAPRAEIDAYRVSADALYEQRDTAHQQAKDNLINATSDPIVKWLVTTSALADYAAERDIALKELPLDEHGLAMLAARENWCGEYDSFVTRMVEDGALTIAEPKRYEMERMLREYGIRGNLFLKMVALIEGHIGGTVTREDLESGLSNRLHYSSYLENIMPSVDEYLITKGVTVAQEPTGEPA